MLTEILSLTELTANIQPFVQCWLISHDDSSFSPLLSHCVEIQQSHSNFCNPAPSAFSLCPNISSFLVKLCVLQAYIGALISNCLNVSKVKGVQSLAVRDKGELVIIKYVTCVLSC